MTPFQAFSLWIRRAPTSQRASAAAATALVLALFVWLIVPSSGPSSSANAESTQAGGVTSTTGAATSSSTTTSTSITTTAGVSSSGSDTSAGSATGGGGTTGGAKAPATSGSSSGATGARCVAPPGTDQGVSATQIKVAFDITSIAGPTGNSAFGVPSPAQQQADWQLVVNSVNASGGIACRTLVPEYYTVNPADSSNLQSTCLDVVQAGVFAMVDTGAYLAFPSVAECYPQHQIPFFTGEDLPAAELQQFYPYLFAGGTYETLYRNTVLGLNSRGFFSPANGFQKLGFIYQDCLPSLVTEYNGLLQQIGVASSQIVTYDVGCPGSFTSPSILEAAIEKFKTAGVTNLTEVQELGDFDNFTTIAQAQGFDPKYGIPDEEFPEISGAGSMKPDAANLVGAVAIDNNRSAEETTPGFAPTAGTVKCNAILQAGGEPPVYQQSDGVPGIDCNLTWELVDAVDRAPALQRNALADGLHATGSIDYSYPYGPNNFSGAGVTYGGEFWRPIGFSESCSCWQVLNPTFSPSF